MGSVWLNSVELPKYKKLEEDISTDVCIVGGGITGITLGYKLKKEGIPFVLIEKDMIASKATGHTTAKITSQHGLLYHYLQNAYSKEYAKDYLYANQEAIEDISRIVSSEKIDCDFVRQNSYVFTNDETKVNDIKKEFDVLSDIGFDAEIVNKLDISVDILSAIKFNNQAKFNPLKYIAGLLPHFSESIYENTVALDIKKNNNGFFIQTENGSCITCKKLVIATKYPIKDIPGFYFTKLYQETSYVLAITTDTKIDGMYISCDTPKISLRSATYNGKEVVLLGGENNRTGEKINTLNAYENLENIAKSLFNNYTVLAKWNTEDAISLDKIPYIGDFSKLYPNCYVATGFNKWGMTSSNVAANILFDKITNRENKYAYVFDSTRFHMIKNRKALSELIKQSVKGLLGDKLKVKDKNYSDLEKGSGKVIKENGKLIGVFKDNSGKLYKVNPKCTHLGCLLHFNRLDKTWDCACHGSRYQFDGTVIYGPSSRDLEKLD
ncbi:MAG: FAD-dependent oxidoreductase [Clostridia bacterium]|nr:FAD-dependent oxidoreductase [Clostridia bacterium]